MHKRQQIQTIGFAGIKAEPIVNDSESAEAGNVPGREICRRRGRSGNGSKAQRATSDEQAHLAEARTECHRTFHQRHPVTFLYRTNMITTFATSLTHTHTQLFYGSFDFVRDNVREPVPEETFTHSHSS